MWIHRWICLQYKAHVAGLEAQNYETIGDFRPYRDLTYRRYIRVSTKSHQFLQKVSWWKRHLGLIPEYAIMRRKKISIMRDIIYAAAMPMSLKRMAATPFARSPARG